jgi:23S rRNA (guanosine2251-2'-O)-methyltransferase
MRKLQTDELHRLTEEELKQAKKNKVIVVLDNVRSLLNVGSVFRTGDAFLIQELWLAGITGTPPNRDIHKSALGSENTVEWKYMTDEVLKRQLITIQQEGWKIIAVEQIDNSISLEKFEVEPNGKYCLILGNEVNGVSEELLPLCDYALEIPQWGTKHSFNISVAAGIVMWEVVKKLVVSHQ